MFGWSSAACSIASRRKRGRNPRCRDGGRQELECDRGRSVTGWPVDDAHAARADNAHDPVARETSVPVPSVIRSPCRRRRRSGRARGTRGRCEARSAARRSRCAPTPRRGRPWSRGDGRFAAPTRSHRPFSIGSEIDPRRAWPGLQCALQPCTQRAESLAPGASPVSPRLTMAARGVAARARGRRRGNVRHHVDPPAHDARAFRDASRRRHGCSWTGGRRSAGSSRRCSVAARPARARCLRNRCQRQVGRTTLPRPTIDAQLAATLLPPELEKMFASTTLWLDGSATVAADQHCAGVSRPRGCARRACAVRSARARSRSRPCARTTLFEIAGAQRRGRRRCPARRARAARLVVHDWIAVAVDNDVVRAGEEDAGGVAVAVAGGR